MDFNDRTKIMIENALKELLKELPFKKITVQKILDQCGCSRPTFYYHFHDKYDVAESIYKRMIAPIVAAFPDITWIEMVTRIYDALNENLIFAKKTLDYNEQGPIVTFLIQYDMQIYEEIFLKYTDLTEISDDLRFQIRFHSMACVGNMAFWLQKEDRETSGKMAESLLNAMPHDLYSILPNKK